MQHQASCQLWPSFAYCMLMGIALQGYGVLIAISWASALDAAKKDVTYVEDRCLYESKLLFAVVQLVARLRLASVGMFTSEVSSLVCASRHFQSHSHLHHTDSPQLQWLVGPTLGRTAVGGKWIQSKAEDATVSWHLRCHHG
jgi:hypothetical protein